MTGSRLFSASDHCGNRGRCSSISVSTRARSRTYRTVCRSVQFASRAHPRTCRGVKLVLPCVADRGRNRGCASCHGAHQTKGPCFLFSDEFACFPPSPSSNTHPGGVIRASLCEFHGAARAARKTSPQKKKKTRAGSGNGHCFVSVTLLGSRCCRSTTSPRKHDHPLTTSF